MIKGADSVRAEVSKYDMVRCTTPNNAKKVRVDLHVPFKNVFPIKL